MEEKQQEIIERKIAELQEDLEELQAEIVEAQENYAELLKMIKGVEKMLLKTMGRLMRSADTVAFIGEN